MRETINEQSSSEANDEQGVDSDLAESSSTATGDSKTVLWVEGIEDRVLSYLQEESEESEGNLDIQPNPYYSVAITKKLKKDAKHFVLSLSMKRDDFGYGSVPASSSPVEATIKTLKIDVLHNLLEHMHLHQFVPLHINYLYGKINLSQAALNRKEILQERETSRGTIL